MSLLQAFSVGLPAIVTDVGGMAEVVRLAKAGFTVEPTDHAQMVAAIVQMGTNCAERERFSMDAEDVFKSLFTLETMVDAYMNLYRT